MENALTILVDQTPENLKVRLIGRLDTTTSKALETEVLEKLKEPINVELDFKELEYISSAGLRCLMLIYKNLKDNHKMTIINCCETVKEVFDITGFTEIFNIK